MSLRRDVRADGQSDGEKGGRTGRLKLMVVFYISANVPNQCSRQNPGHFRLYVHAMLNLLQLTA